MDGKVEVSILQWETIRKEHTEMKESIKSLKDLEKKVKLTIVDKRAGGHLQYNRFNDNNQFVADTKTVEKSEYVGLEDVVRVLRDEEKDKLKTDFDLKESEINKLKSDVHDLRSSADKERITLNRNHKEDLDKKETKFTNTKEKLHTDYGDKLEKKDDTIKEKDNEIAELKGIDIRSEDQKIIENLNKRLDTLTDYNKTLYKKLPWWSK